MTYSDFIKVYWKEIDAEVSELKSRAISIKNEKSRNKYFSDEIRLIKIKWINRWRIEG